MRGNPVCAITEGAEEAGCFYHTSSLALRLKLHLLLAPSQLLSLRQPRNFTSNVLQKEDAGCCKIIDCLEAQDPRR